MSATDVPIVPPQAAALGDAGGAVRVNSRFLQGKSAEVAG
jgi:hypothetical protein